MTILQSLVGYYERLEGEGAVPPVGYSSEKISFALVLAASGDVEDVIDLRAQGTKRPEPKVLVVPASFKRPGTASNPFFLWDKTSYVLGVVDAAKKTSAKDPLQDHRAFVEWHLEMLSEADDEGLQALLAFLRRWDPARYPELRHADEMLDQNVVFMFRSGGAPGFLHDRPAARRIWANHVASSNGEQGICLVTGETGPVARLHPAIKGVPGAQTSGASFVSFNLDAFTSYGKEQGANAPVSERAAHAYATALNTLLSKTRGIDAKGRPHYANRVQIGDATTVFWAEAEGDAGAAERMMSWALDPSPTSEDEEALIRTVLQKIEVGRPFADPDEPGRTLDPETRFYILGLSPNAARLSVRFYLQTTLGDLARRLGEHYRDLRIEPHAWTLPPALWRLLRETAAQGELDNVSPVLSGELARAIVTGRRYPRSLLSLTLIRIRADGEINDVRAAIVRACLARDYRQGFEQEDVPVSLDPGETNPGYRLGRLFAILEKAQRAALGDVNAGIRDKYFSSASANPARVFPLLLRGAQDHLGKIRSSGKGGLAHWFDQAIGEAMAGLPAGKPFPATLSMADQGRFVVGYYHQRSARTATGESDDATATLTDEA